MNDRFYKILTFYLYLFLSLLSAAIIIFFIFALNIYCDEYDSWRKIKEARTEFKIAIEESKCMVK